MRAQFFCGFAATVVYGQTFRNSVGVVRVVTNYSGAVHVCGVAGGGSRGYERRGSRELPAVAGRYPATERCARCQAGAAR